MAELKSHSAISELNKVHAKLGKAFLQKRAISADVARAEKMQEWLYKIKNLDTQDLSDDAIQKNLELKALVQIKEMAGQILGTKGSYIFKQAHFWKSAMDTSQSVGADDISEADLYALLTAAGEVAVNQGSSSKLGVGLVGSASANVQISGALEDMVKKMLDRFGDEIENQQYDVSDIISAPVARSGKADVTGYSKTIDIAAEIKPEWQDFIKLFQGAKFSVKNYTSKNSTSLTIRLGQTNPFKAMYGILSELGYKEQTSVHIYMHARTSYLFGGSLANSEEGAKYIMKMRFAYELTGAGLYDANTGEKLDAVDFLVYNDPASDKIFVRSTKAMIQDFDVYNGSHGDPWHSEIVVLKQSFT